MNDYLRLHRQMKHAYDQREKESSWESEDVRTIHHAVMWLLFSMSEGRKDAVALATIKPRLVEMMDKLEAAKAPHISQIRIKPLKELQVDSNAEN